jgi:hypothetical protein
MGIHVHSNSLIYHLVFIRRKYADLFTVSNDMLTLAFFIANVISNSGVLSTSFGNQLKNKFISETIQTQYWPLLMK